MAALTAIVLCGGAGERMGGADKPLQPLAGRPLIEHVLARLPAEATVVIAANRNAERYRACGAAVVDDGAFGGCGPLGGVAAALDIENSRAGTPSPAALIVPGDAPLLPRDLLARLQRAAADAGCDLAVVDDGSGLQPLCALLPRRLWPALVAYVADGGRSARDWWRSQRAAVADCSDWPRWGWSLNTAAEWSAAEAQLRDTAASDDLHAGTTGNTLR
jgi:molybdopterin-guanine dinucleotide biosynthesis protein A